MWHFNLTAAALLSETFLHGSKKDIKAEKEEVQPKRHFTHTLFHHCLCFGTLLQIPLCFRSNSSSACENVNATDNLPAKYGAKTANNKAFRGRVELCASWLRRQLQGGSYRDVQVASSPFIYITQALPCGWAERGSESEWCETFVRFTFWMQALWSIKLEWENYFFTLIRQKLEKQNVVK